MYKNLRTGDIANIAAISVLLCSGTAAGVWIGKHLQETQPNTIISPLLQEQQTLYDGQVSITKIEAIGQTNFGDTLVTVPVIAIDTEQFFKHYINGEIKIIFLGTQAEYVQTLYATLQAPNDPTIDKDKSWVPLIPKWQLPLLQNSLEPGTYIVIENESDIVNSRILIEISPNNNQTHANESKVFWFTKPVGESAINQIHPDLGKTLEERMQYYLQNTSQT